MRYEGVVDIFQTVKMLRTQRPAMVQTEVRKISMTEHLRVQGHLTLDAKYFEKSIEVFNIFKPHLPPL
jgi:hypothetical protein